MRSYQKLRGIKFFTEKGPSNSTLIITVIICLIMVSILSIKFVFLTNNDYEVPVIYKPTDAIKVNFELNELKKALEVSKKDKVVDVTNFKVEAVKLRGYTQAQVVELYQSEMEKDGWSLTGSDSWYYFRKGAKSVAIAAVNEENATALDYIEKISPALRKQLDIGDVLVTLVHGPYEKIRFLGS